MTTTATSAHDFELRTIDGKPRKLSEYAGRPVLLVNVASKCGLTPQYRGLEALHEEFGPKGLAVVGVPANQFGGQEPGSEAEIQSFCTTNYGVKFDMMSKEVVKGDGIHPLFAFLTDKGRNPEFGGPIAWNFNKFLLDKHGKVVARFEPQVDPTSPEVKAAIARVL